MTNPVDGAAATEPAAAYTLYSRRQRWLFLLVLFLVSTSNFADRNVIAVLLEPIRREFGVSDTQLGLLSGVAFAVLYSTLGIPVARWADRGNRRLIVSLSVATWSVMCALCGMAQTFWQLALARIGVGAGEAGATPPSQSLIIDYFPPEQRARAVAIFTAGASAGSLLGFMAGGQIAATYGWRTAFIMLGLPGVVLALVAGLVLREPRSVMPQPQSETRRESLLATFRALWAKPTIRHVLIGLTFYGFFAFGVLTFVAAFLVRVLHVNMGTVGYGYGAVSVLTTAVGTLAGGWLADRLSRRDRAWLLRLPAIGLVLAFPFYLASFMVRDFTLFIMTVSVAGVLLTGAVPAVFVAAHAVCGSSRRAMSVSIMLFFMILIGGSLGPLAVGLVSDTLRPEYGDAGLAHALSVLTLVMLISAASFWRGSRSLVNDEEK
jgi:predicted MFS family arabinose efflux permease